MAAALTVLTLAAVALLTQRPRALYSAAGTLALLTALWAGALAGTGRPGTAAAVATILSVLVLGVAPKFAPAPALPLWMTGGPTAARSGGWMRLPPSRQRTAGWLGTILCAASIASGLWVLGTAGPNRAWSPPHAGADPGDGAPGRWPFPAGRRTHRALLAAAAGTLH